LEGAELVDDGGGIAVIFSGRHDAEFAVAGLVVARFQQRA